MQEGAGVSSPGRRPNVEGSSTPSGVLQDPRYPYYSGLILQPDSSPISQDQLAAEVKGIYAGLVMVESKCITIDSARAGALESKLGPDQWHPPSFPSRQWQKLAAAELAVAGHKSMSQSETPRFDSEVSGHVNGIKTSAFPDYGGDPDCMSFAFAFRHGFKIDKSSVHKIKRPLGGAVKTLGTITAPWRFAGESTQYDRVFNVLPNCVHDVILGRPFLKLTKTLSDAANFARRVNKKLRTSLAHMFRSYGEQAEALGGFIGGTWVNALPDNGSDFSIMSRAYAERHGFNIETGKKYRRRLRFFDGSECETSGMIEQARWSFELDESGPQYVLDQVLILDDLPYDLILGNDFLEDSQAFLFHQDSFYPFEFFDSSDADEYSLSVIQEVKGGGHQPVSPQARRQTEERRELQRQDAVEDTIASLSLASQQAAWDEELRKRQDWKDRHPPVGWTPYWDPALQLWYYHNEATGLTQWDYPLG